MKIVEPTKKNLTKLTNMCNTFGPAVDVFIRLYLAKLYFNEGYRMFNHAEETILTFSQKSIIPGVSADIMALVYTWSQMLFPVLLLLGLGARLPAIVLTALTGLLIFADWGTFNQTAAGSMIFSQYMLQIFMLGVIIAHGHGKFSLDYKISLKDSDYKY